MEKVKKAVKQLSANKSLTDDLSKNLKQCKSVEDVSFIVHSHFCLSDQAIGLDGAI